MGDPIYAPKGEEIWAFWSEHRDFQDYDVFKFQTRGQLLGEDTRIRNTCVVYSGRKWIAGIDTCQADFENSPFFFPHPLSGSAAKLAAIRLLLADDNFTHYFSGEMASLQAYATHMERRAKEPGW